MAAHDLPVSAANRARFEALLRGGGAGARVTFTLVSPDGAVTTSALDAARHAGLLATVWAAAHAPASGAADLVAATRAACNALAAASARGGGKRVGLTPDWLIAAACDILGLARPSPQQPVVRGLLDPCTNRCAPRLRRGALDAPTRSKRRPNVPAALLYDSDDDGLSPDNAWAGHSVLLNPPYTRALQGAFAERAVREVDAGRVPGVVLVCQNCTQARWFQRLRPFMRCMLRRDAIRFKDYAGSAPKCFGICVLLVCKPRADFHARFQRAMSGRGEVSIPVDRSLVRSPAFARLCERLYAAPREEGAP